MAELPFRIETEAGSFDVVSWRPPPILVLDKEDRTCRLGLRWTAKGPSVDDRGCPQSARSEAMATLDAWSIEASEDARPQELAEIWFVYPHEPDTDVAVLVRQSSGANLTLPTGVDAAPFSILAWTFLRFPDAKEGATDVETCQVDVRADVAGVAQRVRATGCDPAYADAVRDAVKAWRFDPPTLHREPLETSIRFSATFDPTQRPEADEWKPDEDRMKLWTTRQFDALTRAERLWFIRAALTPTVERDLGPGLVRVSLPKKPEIGDREPLMFFAAGERQAQVPLPDHPPIFLLMRPGREIVEVYDAPRPDPSTLGLEGRATCELIVQVDGNRAVVVWAQSCDPEVRRASIDAARDWILQHRGDSRDRERFTVTVRFDADNEAELVFDAQDMQTERADLPAYVHTESPPRPAHRVPPKLPRKLVEERGLPNGECRMEILVTKGGATRNAQIISCPTGFQASALKAVKRWRWDPATVDGQPVAVTTEVQIRFAP
ncbi:MAG: energy transducer TonB [Myxococcales bacterium]|nr:energy transducer TonB [Myxococcales bacterium]